MKLVVGLGNPGKKYDGTRHNVGFDVLNELRTRSPGDRPRGRFSGETIDVVLGGQKVVLLWPHTFMNLSGKSLLAARDFYKLDDSDLLIVCDDFQLPLGKIRVRPSGRSGGQKGLQDCLKRLGTEELPRLRLGVGPLPERWDVADFVLSRFGDEERSEIDRAVRAAADAVEAWIRLGVEEAMNQFNGQSP